MSKEFQIRDGNLIASFDLENEDGDIDFCKLLKVSHGVADEIGMFVDYVATNKIIKDQSKQIADLETQLADLQQEQIKEMQEHQEAMGLADKTITNLVEDNRASQEWYKKQLADTEEQNKRVLEKLELIVSANQELEQKLAESEEKINMLEEHKFYADNIIQAYADKCKKADQDKISFAVEQLTQAKEYIKKSLEDMWNNNAEMTCRDRNIINGIYTKLDEQIEELTHQHKDKGE